LKKITTASRDIIAIMLFVLKRDIRLRTYLLTGLFIQEGKQQLYATSSIHWMTCGLDADAKNKKKKHEEPFWYQKEYKKSVSMLASDIGIAIGKKLRPKKQNKK